MGQNSLHGCVLEEGKQALMYRAYRTSVWDAFADIPLAKAS